MVLYDSCSSSVVNKDVLKGKHASNKLGHHYWVMLSGLKYSSTAKYLLKDVWEFIGKEK